LWKKPEAVIARVNQRVRGWIGYFHHAQSAPVFRHEQRQMRERLRRWLWKKHGKMQAHYGAACRDAHLHEHYGLIRFPMPSQWQRP